MRERNLKDSARLQSGQTLIIALIVLGVLLVLGLVFIGLISRNIRTAAFMQQRSQATDLAEAGIRYAHFQLLHSELGADWRPEPVALAPAGADFTTDPDALYLRPGTGLGLRNPADPQADLGGPDGLGPYTRWNVEGGRALVRVTFAPSDANIFSSDPSGPLRSPGKARAYTIIESIGRPGRLNPNDPTTLPNTGGAKFRNYASHAEFQQELGRMRDRDNMFVSSRKITAFASIGIIESARYITNKFNVTRPAEIGFPENSGVQFLGVPVTAPIYLGGTMDMFNVGNPPTPTTSPIPVNGSLWVNGDLTIHGDLVANLNYTMGDLLGVVGNILGAQSTSELIINRAQWDLIGNAWSVGTVSLVGPALDSRSPLFSTVQGVIRDRFIGEDSQGFPRSLARKEPPSILKSDPDTGQNRYIMLTRNSGRLLATGQSGRFGHGQGVYVNNGTDRQLRLDEDDRADVGTQEALFNDWLNPNNPGGSWKGPFYVPRGAYLQLQNDGFTIVRDPQGNPQDRFWRLPDGSQTNSSTIRYRISPPDVNGNRFIINSFTPGGNINAANPNFAAGFPFNGVLMFEGNVRIRGIIPTDVQMTIVSNANIYIEGSITKGIVDPATGNFLNRQSRSMLMLMAKDYVVLNTTQFFGPAANQDLEEPNEQASSVAWNPVRMNEPNGRINLRTEMLLDPTSGANPNAWQPYTSGYREFVDAGPGNNGNTILTDLLLAHTQEDGAAPYSMISLDVNFGLPTPTYLFPIMFSNVSPVPEIYGLGVENWQRYPKFEAISFPLVDPNTATFAGGVITANGATGTYRILLQETNDFTFRTNNVGSSSTNSYYMARAALVPHDIRIEASMYAEEGSFFVIPGQWFNPNPNDTRERYVTLGTDDAARNQARLEEFGSFPSMPFYGEPLDVRITIIGSVSENMPPPISHQLEWLKKWGWIPRTSGATNRLIPKTHVPVGFDISNAGTDSYVPNLIVTHDPVLVTGRVAGFDNSPANPYLRFRGPWALPPVPRLPVSPTLAYFGEVNP